MTRILFYAPLKTPDHAVPSGDRTVARLLWRALEQAGFELELASRLRARIATPEPLAQETLRMKAWGIADRRIAKLKALPKKDRPRAFFTYHLYYKAVDWIGPRIAAALDIPYLVAEASHAPKRAAGAWAFNHAGAEAAIKAADAIFCLNPGDKDCLALVTKRARLVDLPPFLDLQAFAPRVPDRKAARIASRRSWAAARHRAAPTRKVSRRPARCCARPCTSAISRARWPSGAGRPYGRWPACSADCRVIWPGCCAPHARAAYRCRST